MPLLLHCGIEVGNETMNWKALGEQEHAGFVTTCARAPLAAINA